MGKDNMREKSVEVLAFCVDLVPLSLLRRVQRTLHSSEPVWFRPFSRCTPGAGAGNDVRGL
jgi:hypothetical protein